MPRLGPPKADEHPLLLNHRMDWTIAVLLGLVTAATFTLMAPHVTREFIHRLDVHFLDAMVRFRTPALTVVAKVFNVLGLVYVTLPVRLAVAAYLVWRRRWWHLAAFVSAMVVSELCIGPVKALFAEARPPGSLVSTTGASFPSGHAVAASVTAVAIVIALFPPRHRGLWGAVAVAFSVLMGMSRAYLAAHWIWDAIAGVLLGTSVAIWTALLVQAVREARSRRVGAKVLRHPVGEPRWRGKALVHPKEAHPDEELVHDPAGPR